MVPVHDHRDRTPSSLALPQVRETVLHEIRLAQSIYKSLPSLRTEKIRGLVNVLANWIFGAGDRDRTGDIQLGKLAFYR